MNTLKIEQDTNAESPDKMGDDGLFLIAKHRDFFVTPPDKDRAFEISTEIEIRAKTHHVFPLEAYIHSGVVLALSGQGPFPDRQWDVSQLGVVFVSKEEWRLTKSARKAALALVQEWNQYLSGDVWGYVIRDDQGNHLDSCWGFYGHNYATEEGQRALSAIAESSLCEANQI